MASVETWVGFGSAMAGVGLLWSRMPEHVHEEARYIISSLVPMAMSYFNPYEQITVSEYGEERFRRNKMFGAVSTYLSRVCAGGACKLKAELCNNTKDDPVVTLDENQEVVDSFDGARMWWRLCPKASKNKGAITVSYYPGETDEPRCFRLVFHKRHRQLVLSSYLPSVVRRWRELTAKNRQRRLFTNHASEGNKSVWTSVPYNPPATFDMLAMDHAKKVDIMEDLTVFQKGKEYHSKVGKAWKRGYLLQFADKNDEKSRVTLSGLLSFVNRLWSACGSERVFMFTTNHIDWLDPALIWPGRMDKHIEMSYCRFEAFKVLAKSYLDITDHSLFAEIGQLLDETDTTPADVADNLMVRSKRNGEISRLLLDDEMDGSPPADVANNFMLRCKRKRDADECLAGLVQTLKKAKMESATPPMDTIEEEAKEEHNLTQKKATEGGGYMMSARC
uniref:Cell Division Protein AAA ATPase family, putative, expressed n=1 Tax=Oryza sativa subsp. japonica TaxID=39947 RepID=Q2QR58_ORYSJ|nr:Cell Division Protein AAA ATPase family, putative, expressed [Oryza sativa Japonica Group]